MRKILVLVVIAMLGLVVVACGGGANKAPEPVNLSFVASDDFKYTPDSATVAAGAPVTVLFTNSGALQHNWELISNDVDPLTAVAGEALNGATSGEIEGGTSATFNFTAPGPGTYKFVCTVAGHAAGGMVGTLTVTP